MMYSLIYLVYLIQYRFPRSPYSGLRCKHYIIHRVTSEAVHYAQEVKLFLIVNRALRLIYIFSFDKWWNTFFFFTNFP